MAKRMKYTTLDLSEKIKVILGSDKDGKSSRFLAEQFNVGKTQILNILKRKREYLDDYERNAPSNKKRCMRKTGNEDINNLCWNWFTDSRSRMTAVSGPLLQEKALHFAKELGNTTFTASNGWLDSFKKCNNIGGAIMAGESGAVNQENKDEFVLFNC